MTTSFLSNSIEVIQTKQAVEARYGSCPDSPADFAELSLHIQKATGKAISPDTLSRLWGYKKGYATVRRSIIELLNEYARTGNGSECECMHAVTAEELHPKAKVRIAWMPDSVCTLEYTGKFRWRVVTVKNSKLQAGDTFFCRVIAQGLPLIADTMQTAERKYDVYTIGGKNGLTTVEKTAV